MGGGKRTLTTIKAKKYSLDIDTSWTSNRLSEKKFISHIKYEKEKGGKIIGEFKDGKPHGKGIKTSADGEVSEGLWENGEFIGAE